MKNDDNQGELFGDQPKPRKRVRETSLAAWHAVSPERAARLQRHLMHCLRERPSTADELARAVGESRFTVRPTCSKLVDLGLIEDSGLRRKNVSGKPAIVWRVVDNGPKKNPEPLP